MRPRLLPAVVMAVACLSTGAARSVTATADLPARLTDQEFWQLSQDLSEPDGVFQSDNLLSNEVAFGRLVPELSARTAPGGVYLGVGPAGARGFFRAGPSAIVAGAARRDGSRSDAPGRTEADQGRSPRMRRWRLVATSA